MQKLNITAIRSHCIYSLPLPRYMLAAERQSINLQIGSGLTNGPPSAELPREKKINNVIGSAMYWLW